MTEIKIEVYDMLKGMYDNCISLSKLDQLKYESLDRDIEKANNLFNLFEHQCSSLVDTLLLLSPEDPIRKEQSNIVYKRSKRLAYILSKIALTFQKKIEEKGAEYAKQMDEIHTAFYMPCIEGLVENREQITEARDKEDQEPLELIRLLASALTPDESHDEKRQELLNQYDNILKELSQLHRDVEGTFLDSSTLQSLFYVHRIKDVDGIGGGGLRGQTNLHHNLSRMMRRRLGELAKSE